MYSILYIMVIVRERERVTYTYTHIYTYRCICIYVYMKYMWKEKRGYKSKSLTEYGNTFKFPSPNLIKLHIGLPGKG